MGDKMSLQKQYEERNTWSLWSTFDEFYGIASIERAANKKFYQIEITFPNDSKNYIVSVNGNSRAKNYNDAKLILDCFLQDCSSVALTYCPIV